MDDRYYDLTREYMAAGYSDEHAAALARDLLWRTSRPKAPAPCPECDGCGLGPVVYRVDGFDFPSGLRGPCEACGGTGRVRQ